MNNAIELSLSEVPISKLRQVILDRASDDLSNVNLRLLDGAGRDFVGVGFSHFRKVDIVGALGNYACSGFSNSECMIDGDVGDFLAQSIQSGVVIARGNAGHCAGAMGAGGFISVYGNAGDRVGASLRGADVFIRGNVGNYAGLHMRSGTIIVGGIAGSHLGTGMRGGTIYLRGDAESISSDIEEQRLREPDRLKLGLLLMKAGIKATGGKDFRVFRSVHEVR